ncbi:MAG: DUF4303 domain-containing protein [Xanthomonadaceae bacterium]|nr:DUF4303 domain-containing protein [Xanthomonadaceae bacterium]
MDTKALHDLAVESITAGFGAIRRRCGDEQMYGFALGLVEDITGFFCAGNTLEALGRKVENQDLEQEDIVYLAWAASEWEYQDHQYLDVGQASRVRRFVTAEYEKGTPVGERDGGYFEAFTRQYHETLIEALKTCDRDGLFGTGEERENLVVFLDSVDDAYPDLMEISSARINPELSHQWIVEYTQRVLHPEDDRGP